MADGVTVNYEFVQPEIGASQDTWGGKLNANWASADVVLFSLQGQIESITTGASGGLVGSGNPDDGYELTADIATAANLRAGAAEKLVDAKSVYDAAAFVTLTYGATVAVDLDAGRNFVLTLTGEAELSNPTNQKPGQAGVIVVRQDGTGGRALSYGANWRFPSGPIAVATGANAISVISYLVLESGVVLAIQARDFTT